MPVLPFWRLDCCPVQNPAHPAWNTRPYSHRIYNKSPPTTLCSQLAGPELPYDIGRLQVEFQAESQADPAKL